MERKTELGGRQAALENLERFRRDGAWSGAGIDSSIKKYGLDAREAALAARLSLGVLQNSMLCDFYIGCFCKSRLEPKVRDILRLGVYQILFMDKIPARAAVNESVELCKKLGYSRVAGLVNAVLRRIAENSGSLPEIPGRGSAAYLSIKYSHPQWLCQYIIDKKDYAFAEAFLATDNQPAKLSIQVNRLRISPEKYAGLLAEAGVKYRLYPGLSGCIQLEGGNVAELPGFDEGLFYVQDRAARMAIEIAAPVPGMTVLDACAAPGGKSYAAAIAMEGRGKILACDIHEKKLGLISSGAERLGIDIIDTCARDARQADEKMTGAFELVIADVPCSGFGVIGKKPEIRSKSREAFKELPRIQGDILNNLAGFVKPGGTLLYSTCTIFEEENQNVVREFLSHREDFSLRAFSAAGIDSTDGMYTFWPNVDGTDGFFAAKLVRKI